MNVWILGLIKLVVGVVSPEIRTGVKEALNALAEKAKKTTNPWDDMLVDMLKQIMTGD